MQLLGSILPPIVSIIQSTDLEILLKNRNEKRNDKAELYLILKKMIVVDLNESSLMH